MKNGSYVSFSFAFIQRVNYYNQFRALRGGLYFRQRLEDEFLKLFCHRLFRYRRVGFDCVSNVRHQRGQLDYKLSSDGGEKPASITTITFTSLKEETGA